LRNYQFITRSVFILLCTFCFLTASSIKAQDKLPVEKAGTIGQAKGKVAFIRDGSIWMYNLETNLVEKISGTANKNSVGRLSWSPDNSKIMFTRSGRVSYTGTADDGGNHKLYDLFVAFLDSVKNGNRSFWNRITFDFGSRDPQWSADGKRIIFWNDKNASQIDTPKPNYQIMTMTPDGEYPKHLRKDWLTMEDVFLVNPSMNSKGDLAFVVFYDFKPQGLAVVHESKMMTSIDSLKLIALKNRDKILPAWSPDDKWIAFIKNKIDDAGLFITTPDLKETYLVFTPPVSTYLSTAAAPCFSPDSKYITFGTTDGSVWVCDITGKGARRLTPPGQDSSPAWSR